jgi:hypothetical protein
MDGVNVGVWIDGVNVGVNVGGVNRLWEAAC